MGNHQINFRFEQASYVFFLYGEMVFTYLCTPPLRSGKRSKEKQLRAYCYANVAKGDML
jgi:hypothetical protein